MQIRALALAGATLATSLQLVPAAQAEDKTKSKNDQFIHQLELTFARPLGEDGCKTQVINVLVETSSTSEKVEVAGKYQLDREVRGASANISVTDSCNSLNNTRARAIDFAGLEAYLISAQLADYSGLPGVGVAENTTSECGTFEYFEGIETLGRSGVGQAWLRTFVDGVPEETSVQYGSVEPLKSVDECMRAVTQSFADGVATVQGTIPVANYVRNGFRYELTDVDSDLVFDLTATGVEGSATTTKTRKKWQKVFEDGEFVGRFPFMQQDYYEMKGDEALVLYNQVDVEGVLALDGENLLDDENLTLVNAVLVRYDYDDKTTITQP